MGTAVWCTAMEGIAEHLRFLGFDAECTDGTLIAQHRTRANMTVATVAGGLLHRAAYGIYPERLDDIEALYHAVNASNARAYQLHFYITTGDNPALMIEALYLGEYDRLQYGAFLDLWETDLRNALTMPEMTGLLT